MLRLAVTSLSLLAASSSAGTIFVRTDCAGGAGDGSSWADAFCGPLALGDALAVAQAGDEVWVAQGVYKPAGAGGPNDSTFVIPPGVAVLGGFNGDETDGDQRDPARFVTTLSGDLNGDDIRTNPPFPQNTSDNTLHVVTIIDGQQGTILDGLTIRAGQASLTGDPRTGWGGNILIEGGAATIRGCVITDGLARLHGGGIAIIDAQVDIDRCVITNNVTNRLGGGISSLQHSTTRISDTLLTLNIGGRGCGVYSGPINENASVDPMPRLELEDCRFEGNYGVISTTSGGAVFANRSVLRAKRCAFVNNEVSTGGGAIFGFSDDIRVDSCVFVGNNAVADGGGVYYGFALGDQQNSPPLFVNCTMIKNNGVLALFPGAGARFVNCTMAHNVHDGPFWEDWNMFDLFTDSYLQLHNCVIWDNDPERSNFLIRRDGVPQFSISNCIIDDWDGSIPGHAFIADPMFIDPAGPDMIVGTEDDDLRLSDGSPAIDAGAANLLPPDAQDLDSDGDAIEPVPLDLDDGARLIGHAPDLGAYERTALVCPADLNADGLLNFFDVSVFLSAFTSSSPPADLNGDGAYDFFDVSALIGYFSNPDCF